MKVAEKFGDDWEIIKHIFGRMNTDDFNYNYVIRNLCKYELLELFDKYYKYDDDGMDGYVQCSAQFLIEYIIHRYKYFRYYNEIEDKKLPKEYIHIMMRDDDARVHVIKWLKHYSIDYKEFL